MPGHHKRLIEEPKIASLLSEVTDFAVFSLDPDGICTAWEPISQNYQSTPVSELVGSTLDKFYPEEQRPQYWANIEVAREKGRADGEGWRRRWDGSLSWMRFILDAERNEAGEIIGFNGIVHDATRQRDSERALHESEETLRMLVEGLDDHALYMLDKNGRVTTWNSGAERTKGYRAEEIVGHHFSIFFTPEDRARNLPDLQLAEALEKGRYEGEGWRIRKDGTRYLARAIIQPIRDPEGRFIGFAKLSRDISSELQAAQDLADVREALIQSEKLRSLGELTGGIAHDFNNLLTVVRGSAELLQRGGLSDDKRQRHIAAIVETADRAAELTGQLLSFARRQPLQPKPIDLNALIDDIADLLRRTLGGGISVLKAPQPGLWLVKADRTQLQNLIINAAINARDAMNGKGTLTIATRNVAGAEGEQVRLTISDTGTGMTPEAKARAFEPFFTTKAPGKGTGLGLSQAYGFAAQSGGKLELASELGRGTSLKLFLPRGGDAADIGTAPIEAEGQVPRGTRILLVEDSRTVAIFAQSLLEDMGCEIVYCANAEDALTTLEAQPDSFDIVFSDIVMPGLSGLDLAAQVRNQKPTLPILLATGYSEAAARGEGGEFPILPKPYRRDALASMLGRAMHERRAEAA